jgi:hypothetical protein
MEAKWLSVKRNEKLMKRNKAKNKGNFISLLLDAKKANIRENLKRIIQLNKLKACETDLFSYVSGAQYVKQRHKRYLPTFLSKCTVPTHLRQ